MRTRRTVTAILWVLSASICVAGAPEEEAVNSIRARLAELGHSEVMRWEGKLQREEGPLHKRSPSEEALYHLSREPRRPVREAIEQALKIGSKEECIGALTLYLWIVESGGHYFANEPLNPTYHPLLLDLLARDDFTTPAYTSALTWVLERYRSRKTVLALMDGAARTRDLQARKALELRAAQLVGIELDIDQYTIPFYVEKRLAEFEAWYAKNKDRIRLDKDGDFHLSGRSAPERPPRLTPEDRDRIRQDPVCVLRLARTVLSDEEDNARASELNKQCGPALFGPAGSELAGRMASEADVNGQPSLELRAELASVAKQYPMTDAQLLAAVYVAAFEEDPEAVELAKETLIRFSPAEVRRAAKGEPKSVIKKAVALANETKAD